MKRKLLGVIAGIMLAMTCLGLNADRAEAHNQDNNSYLGCAVLKPSPASDWSVDHSWWVGLYSSHVDGRCMWHNIWSGTRACAIMHWVNPGQPGQYFVSYGMHFGDDCYFSPHET